MKTKIKQAYDPWISKHLDCFAIARKDDDLIVDTAKSNAFGRLRERM